MVCDSHRTCHNRTGRSEEANEHTQTEAGAAAVTVLSGGTRTITTSPHSVMTAVAD
jgi:hypothetical protein